jgi:hypothetical protein
MRQTKSFQNFKNKKKGNNKNLDLFNALSLRLKDFESPYRKYYGVSSSSKNIINNKRNKNNNHMNKGEKNNSHKEKKNSHYSSPNEKDSNLINIRLNINSEIINNNFTVKNNDNLNKEYHEEIRNKNNIISSLEKELSEVKEKINKIQTKTQRKRLNSVDNIEKHYYEKRKKNNNQLTKEFNKIFNIQNLQPSNIISKNVKQFFKNLMLKKENELKGNNSSKKNLILNTSNYNSYIRNKENNVSSKNLYSDPTREIQTTELEKNIQTMKNSSSMIKSSSFLFTSNNLNSTSRKGLEKNNRRSQSQFQTYYTNYSNNNYSNNSNSGVNVFYELEKVKQRTQSLLSSYLNFCSDK